MDWKTEYNSKLRSALDAVRNVKPGDTVVPSHIAGEPRDLMHALCMRVDSGEIDDVNVVCGYNISDGEYAKPQYASKIKVATIFVTPPIRNAVAENRADYVPMHFSRWPKAMRTGKLKADFFFTQVSPPDENGFCSYGVAPDMSFAFKDSAKYSIALVNPNMPRIHGGNFVRITDFDYLVESNSPIYGVQKGAAVVEDEISNRIGKLVADLVEDGDTLQIGVGNIPDAIMRFLGDKKDLGIHSEMFPEGAVPLIKSGVINGRKKEIDNAKMTAAFFMGTREYYDFLDDNPIINGMPVDYVNNPAIIAKLDNMVSINSALEIDLTGQIVSEAVGTYQFSGTGGQVDFIRGASMAKNGRSILAFQSFAKPRTAKPNAANPNEGIQGEISRITAVLKTGTPLTTLRTDVDYIVTEYGVARLFGKSVKERGKALIEIAHPKFREGLEKEMYEFYYGK